MKIRIEAERLAWGLLMCANRILPQEESSCHGPAICSRSAGSRDWQVTWLANLHHKLKRGYIGECTILISSALARELSAVELQPRSFAKLDASSRRLSFITTCGCSWACASQCHACLVRSRLMYYLCVHIAGQAAAQNTRTSFAIGGTLFMPQRVRVHT